MKSLLHFLTSAVGFLRRNWVLLAFTVLANYLTLWNHAVSWIPNGTDEWGHPVWRGLTLFDVCGAILYVPGLFCAALFCARLGRAFVYHTTIEADANDGTYQMDWKLIEARDRVCVSTAISIGFLISAAIVAASMAK